jgi:hypothetical protein
LFLCVLCVLCVDRTFAQVIDPKQMAGIPRPEPADPAGTVTVRVIRGELANRVLKHPVELIVNGKPQTVSTDEEGRARFDKLPAGATLKAVTTVDGERLESQPFQAPVQGGIRVMLVATDKDKAARAAAEASAPPVSAPVVLGGDSRIELHPSDEAVDIFYFLEIMNNGRAPANPPVAFDFEMPEGAGSATLLEGSTPQALATGSHVRVNGPFPPGVTQLVAASRIPVKSGTLDIEQVFPANIEQLMVLVKKVGDTRLVSPQIERQQDMPLGGDRVIAAVGGAVPAGTPVSLTLADLPHHSATPRYVALGIVVAMVLAGVASLSRRQPPTDEQAERQRLITRRDRLFQDLVRLEHDHRNGRGNPSKYPSRREELIAALERVYGALDTEESGLGPADRSGLPA